MSTALLASINAALALIAPPSIKATAANPSQTALKLTQTHFFMGKNLVYIAKNAVRIENVSQFKFILVAKAPTWEVTVYNQADKTFYSQKYADFMNSGILSKFVLGENLQDLENPALRHSVMKIGPAKVDRLTCKFLTVKYIPYEQYTTKQVERILFATYQLPANDGIPVGLMSELHGSDLITGMRIEGQMKTSLDTSNIEEVKTPEGFYDPPRGYTRAKAMRLVVSGENSRQQSRDLDIMLDRKN